MNRCATFDKVSFEQFKNDVIDEFGDAFTEELIKGYYDAIKLPRRATSGSAGYDFFLPFDISIGVNYSNATVKIPTGIRCKMDDGWVLCELPRSGYGFKYGIHMANTMGVIDSDYYYSDNEGHIFIKLVNDSVLSQPIDLNVGDAFCQGIFFPYGITTDDNAEGIRNGGFGSTGC